MAYCVLPNDKEYQTLSKRSGINTESFRNYVGYYRERYGRDPNLDEIPNADSSEYLKTTLGIHNKKYVNTTKLLTFTLEQDLNKMLLKLNNIFRDKEIELIPTKEEVIIKIIDRPSKYKVGEDMELDITNPDSVTFFVDGLYKMTNLYGINFKIITNKDIEQNFLDLHVLDSKAFIYNGDIYINIDNADLDSPVHEMLHILIGTMRFTNPSLYQILVLRMQELPDFEALAKSYDNRTMNDVSEEILVDQIANLLTKKEQSIIPKDFVHDILYEIRRNLDTLLMGKYSVNSVPLNDVFNMSLTDLGKLVKSSRLANNFDGLLTNGFAHRVLNNIKSDLLRSEELKQHCV